MILTYNGVRLQLVDFIKRERDLVYDSSGVDVIYVKHVIGAVCTYSRGGYPVGTEALSVSAAANADVSNPPVLATFTVTPPIGPRDPVTLKDERSTDAFQFGVEPIRTDAELRVRLLTPRKQLLIGAYGVNGSFINWLESPVLGARMDSSGGPYPRALDIVDSSGDANSIGVYFEIETCLPPCHTGEDQIILSHRWQMTHTHDENFYLTRIINGEIVFNAYMLDATGINPDWFRNQFFHPIPLGFRRNIPEVTRSTSGHTIHYTVTDTDESIVFDPADTGATQMTILEEMTQTVPIDLHTETRGADEEGWWGRNFGHIWWGTGS